LLSVSEVAVCIRVLRDLRVCQCWKGRDDAKNEWSYVAEKVCPATGVTGPGRRLPPCPLYRPELRAVTVRSDFRGFTRPRLPASDRACAPSSVAAARRRLLTPSTGAVRGAPSSGGRFHPPTGALCRPPRPPRADALRGGVTVLPVGVARRRRAAPSAVAVAAPLSPAHAPPSTATWLYVPPGVLPAMEPAGVPGVDASPSAPPPRRPGCCTHVPGIENVNRSIYGPSQPRRTLVWERMPATIAPTAQTAKQCHVWPFGRLEPLVETLSHRGATANPNYCALPNFGR